MWCKQSLLRESFRYLNSLHTSRNRYKVGNIMSQSTATTNQQRVRFEEVTPAHEYAAFFSVSIESLVAHLNLPIFAGYDDLDNLQLAFLTLKSGQTVTLGQYFNSPQPGTSLYIDSAKSYKYLSQKFFGFIPISQGRSITQNIQKSPDHLIQNMSQ
jgi:hypothetical protein